MVAEQLPQRDDQQVADRVVVHLTVAGEPVLEHPCPGAAPVVVAAQCGERHPQVAGWQHPELLRSRPEEPPLSATVTTAVRSSDRRGAQRRQRGDRPCRRPGRRPSGRGRGPSTPHSRPRSRWMARDVVADARPAGAAISSAIATLRCLPPVQPIATVMNRLPSAGSPAATPSRTGRYAARKSHCAGLALARSRRRRASRPLMRPQLADPVRVRQEPHVGDEVGVERDAVLEAEADHVGLQAGGVGVAERLARSGRRAGAR